MSGTKDVEVKLDQAAKSLSVLGRGISVVEDLECRLRRAEQAIGPHKPTLANDITAVVAPIPLMTPHATFPTMETSTPAFWVPGKAANKNKLTGAKVLKVHHRRKAIVMQDHDVGPAILHLVCNPIPATAAALSALATLFSSRKCMFGAAKILLEKTAPVGSCTLTNYPPTPMLNCADPVPLPAAGAPTSHLNKVRFKMAPSDYVLGALAIVTEQVVAGIASRVAGKLASGLPPGNPVADFLVENVGAGPLKSLAISVNRSAQVALLGEKGQRTSVGIDFHGRAFSIDLERTEYGDLRLAETIPDDEDAKYGLEQENWGEVL